MEGGLRLAFLEVFTLAGWGLFGQLNQGQVVVLTYDIGKN